MDCSSPSAFKRELKDSCRNVNGGSFLEGKEHYSSKANFISQFIESTNAKFGVTNIDILSKAKAAKLLAKISVMEEEVQLTPCKPQ